MKTRYAVVAAIASLLFASGPVLAQDADVKPHVPLQKTIGVVTPTGPVPSLFVVNSAGAKLEGGKLTMTGVAANSIVFADRPVRAAGHVTTEQFIMQWDEGADNFIKDPPNATISVLGGDGSKVEDAVVTLRSPKIEAGNLTFDVSVLEGSSDRRKRTCSTLHRPRRLQLLACPGLSWLLVRRRACDRQPIPVLQPQFHRLHLSSCAGSRLLLTGSVKGRSRRWAITPFRRATRDPLGSFRNLTEEVMEGLLKTLAAAVAGLCLLLSVPASAQETGASAKPNILVIMGDDIGYWNISAYNRGMMGYRTPNIDRIAAEGALFTDYYGQQSCTAGRAAFISGQSPMRTGLLKVGLPGAKEGLSDKDPTIADLLKPLGYMTGQFGKNHLGDRNEFLPSVHGFDEFFGNLYHLNAEDEPEHPEYPKGTEFRMTFGPRGVLRCTATSADAPGEDPRFGAWGRQNCEDTGPLDKKRMETVDEEFLAATMDFIGRAHAADKPFFAWFNPSRMHIWTHLKPESQGKTGLGVYPDGMVEHDGQVEHCLPSSTSLASPTTPLSSTPPTMVQRRSAGRTGARQCSAARRTPIGRAATGCQRWCAGRVPYRRAARSTAFSRPRTGCRHCSPPPANLR